MHIAQMLRVSSWTIYRRVEEYGLSCSRWSNISDDQLDEVIGLFMLQHGTTTGQSYLTGYVRSLGHLVQRDRVRAAIDRVYPENSALHGGIDGFSRMITFLRYSTNNRADTALSAFQWAMQQFRMPSCIRGDHGGESVEVARYMVLERGEGRGSFVAGPSTRKQRIERLFYAVFYSLEESGYLNISNPPEMFLLHYIFLP